MNILNKKLKIYDSIVIKRCACCTCVGKVAKALKANMIKI